MTTKNQITGDLLLLLFNSDDMDDLDVEFSDPISGPYMNSHGSPITGVGGGRQRRNEISDDATRTKDHVVSFVSYYFYCTV